MKRKNLHNSSSIIRENNNTVDLVDRISALPESILGTILSFIPTKNAVATTILSKRWKLVWINVHNLDFRHNDDWNNKLCPPEDDDMKFVGFVNRVLLLLDGGLLNKFSLMWSPRFIPSQVSSWINTAITRNVNHLFVSVLESSDSNFETMEVPVSLFGCVSLQSLELKGSISVSDEIVVCLPRLESLKLDSVKFESEEAFEKLISGCSMLNYLWLRIDNDKMATYSEGNDDFTYIIFSTSLRRLEIFVEHSEDWTFYSRPILELEASSLEYLKLVGFLHKVFVQGTLSSLVDADFRIQYFTECEESEDELYEDIETFNSVVDAVREFNCAKTLTLSTDVMWALSKASFYLGTKFTRLTKLEAKAVFCYCSSLQEFIQSSDNLEVLKIHQDYGRLGESAIYQDHSGWADPMKVPRCLSNSLKVVELGGYVGDPDEYEMIGYMLMNGNALEVMQVTCCHLNNKEDTLELVKDICKLPRKSLCKVECIG